MNLGEIAVLYPAAWIGDAVANAAQTHGFATTRTDSNALYPRASAFMRWLELCAVWCCGGWRNGKPRFGRIVTEGNRVFAEALRAAEDRREFQRSLIRVLWERRDSTANLNRWLSDLHEGLIADLAGRSRTLDDEVEILSAFHRADGCRWRYV